MCLCWYDHDYRREYFPHPQICAGNRPPARHLLGQEPLVLSAAPAGGSTGRIGNQHVAPRGGGGGTGGVGGAGASDGCRLCAAAQVVGMR